MNSSEFNWISCWYATPAAARLAKGGKAATEFPTEILSVFPAKNCRKFFLAEKLPETPLPAEFLTETNLRRKILRWDCSARKIFRLSFPTETHFYMICGHDETFTVHIKPNHIVIGEPCMNCWLLSAVKCEYWIVSQTMIFNWCFILYTYIYILVWFSRVKKMSSFCIWLWLTTREIKTVAA